MAPKGKAHCVPEGKPIERPREGRVEGPIAEPMAALRGGSIEGPREWPSGSPREGPIEGPTERLLRAQMEGHGTVRARHGIPSKNHKIHNIYKIHKTHNAQFHNTLDLVRDIITYMRRSGS